MDTLPGKTLSVFYSYAHEDSAPTSVSWLYLDHLLPGAHPLEALALVLARTEALGNAVALQRQLESDSKRALHLLASQLAPAPEAKVVLMIDQFEEIFTQTVSEQERRTFIDLLVTAVTEPDGPFIALLTLRADFSDRPMLYPELSHLIETHRVPVLPMDLQDLRAVIEQPAQLSDIRLTFEGNLVNELLFEMKNQPRALPLLEFTLEQLFQRRRGHQITLQAYHEMGGVTGALSRHAEETYARLPSAEHRRLARVLFMRLINPGDMAQDATRRRALFSEFALADATKTLLMEQTIDVFTTARLLTVNEIGGAKMVELSHEALLSEWKRLTDWIKEAYEDIHFQQRFSRDVAEWEKLKEPLDRLYRVSVLKDAQRWEERNTPSEKENIFLRASVIQRRKEHFLRRATAIGVVMVIVFSLGLGPILNFVQSFAHNSCALSLSNVVDGGSTAFSIQTNGTFLRIDAMPRGALDAHSG